MIINSSLSDDYYFWLLDIIDSIAYPDEKYSEVLEKLYETEFYDLVPNDINRAEDGYELRGRFASEIGEHEYYVMDALYKGCSVLEVMIALAMRWEENIAWDPDYGDRTYKWFWIMMDNLGLTFYDDEKYDETEVENILQSFLERKYCTDGRGGLFRINNPNIDMTKVEIWLQMNYYFDENSNLM